MVKAVVGANWGDEGKGKITDMLAKCHKVTVTEVRNRGILMKTAGQVLRLVAPLM